MDVWSFILNKLNASTRVILLYVLHSEGSSPGRQGFKMAVAADSSFCGSIGGGIMEYKFVEMAKAILAQGQGSPGVYRQVHNKATGKDQSGMICSGEQTIFLYLIQDEDRPVISRLTDSMRDHRNGTLLLSPEGIRFLDEPAPVNYSFEKITDDDFLLIEKTGYKNTLHIIGGGHCSLALSRLMHTMDFYTHLYEVRENLNTLNENNFVNEKHFLTSYERLGETIRGSDNDYVVVMTVGYRSDELAIRALAGKNFRYLGILGSKSKMKKMLSESLRDMDDNFLKNLRAPAGLGIKSQTPEEIAISIAAEIIAVKNRDQ
jgi:xanthine dehydrogenase accessory factor